MVYNIRIIDKDYKIHKYNVTNITETQIKRFCLCLMRSNLKNKECITLNNKMLTEGFNSLAKVVYEFSFNDEIIVYDFKYNKNSNKLVRSKRIKTIKL